VILKRLDPDVLEGILPQSQKKKTTKRIRKYSEEKIYQGVHRKKMTTGFNLLTKCVPGIEMLNRPDMLMKTVKYIREQQNKVRELEKRNTTPMVKPTDCETGMKRDSVQNTDCTESAPREPQMADPSRMGNGLTSYSDISEPNSQIGLADSSQMVTGLTSLMADYSDISEPNSPIGQMVTDILEMAVMEDHSTVEMDELAVNSEEEEEELPEFNSIEDLRQWLGV
jgi:hypothetical protein